MKITKRKMGEDDFEFTVTLNSLETIKLIAMDHNAVANFSAALLRSMEGMVQGGAENEQLCNDREIQ